MYRQDEINTDSCNAPAWSGSADWGFGCNVCLRVCMYDIPRAALLNTEGVVAACAWKRKTLFSYGRLSRLFGFGENTR